MPDAWSVQDAKGRFAELLDKAEREGPQTLTRRGRPVAVVLSLGEHRRLLANQPSLKDWLLGGPAAEGFEAERDLDVGRDVDLEG